MTGRRHWVILCVIAALTTAACIAWSGQWRPNVGNVYLASGFGSVVGCALAMLFVRISEVFVAVGGYLTLLAVLVVRVIADQSRSLLEGVPATIAPALEVAIWNAIVTASVVLVAGVVLIAREEKKRIGQLTQLMDELVAICPEKGRKRSFVVNAFRYAVARNRLKENLVGSWKYRVTTSDATYAHEGDCTFTAELGKLCLQGERTTTVYKEGDREMRRPHGLPVHWSANRVAYFEDSGGLGILFDYDIDIDGQSRRGYCVARHNADRNQFVGPYAYFSRAIPARLMDAPEASTPVVVEGTITFFKIESEDSTLRPK